MNNTPTREQQAAISTPGKVIVSASAGSGKTFVMIERLLSLILEGADVSRMLAVTFTNKAADQMKDKLRTALIKRIEDADGRARLRLREQLNALPSAEISTIHSFCSHLIKTYFYLLELDPAFRIISPDDPEGKLLSARALGEVFEAFYGEGGEAFERLLSVYFYKKKDEKLRRMITDLYQDVRGLIDYRALLQRAGEDRFDEACAYLHESYRALAGTIAGEAEALEAFFFETGGKETALAEAVASLARTLQNTDNLFSMAAAARKMQWGRVPPKGKLTGEPLKRHERLKAVSAALRELQKELGEYAAEDEERARQAAAAELARGLSELVLRYDEAYARLKREAGVLDYDDLEHLALTLLERPEVRAAVRAKYAYLFVDEYQDVNPTQEKILSLIEGNEVFLVGDAKQSIYAFRGSRSEYFARKEHEFHGALPLSESFRSSHAVLEAVNRVFSYAMTREICAVSYRDRPMCGGTRFGLHEGSVSFRLVKESEAKAERRGVYSVLKPYDTPPDSQAETIADLVMEELGSEWYDADRQEIRPVGFGDITILVRKKSGQAERIVSALSSRDIPVTTSSTVNVCSFWEAKLVIDWLSYLDNPMQDIPLAAALLSRIGDFRESELMRIRECSPEAYTFREACMRYPAEDTIGLKLKTFFLKAEKYRAQAQLKTAAETVDLLLGEGLEAEIAAKKDGPARLSRVRRLMSDGACSVNEFLRRLKSTDYEVNFAEFAGENVVKVLTMHSAKGLEFPIVILAGMDAPFHGPDRDEVLFTERFLFAPKSYDLNERTVHETVLRRASALLYEREERGGELNLLYVAMTRAKYRLHLIFSGGAAALSPAYAKKMSDFIDLDDCADYFAEGAKGSEPPIPRDVLATEIDEARAEELLRVYQREYPYPASVRERVKSSATELIEQVRQARTVFEETFERSTVEEGIAYHAFLEHVKFGARAEEELLRMKTEGLLSCEQAALLDPARLEAILKMPAFSALCGKETLREQRFLVLLPACEVKESASSDEIVLQGAIDLLYPEGEGWVILDYKDSSHGAEELKARYAPQIRVYRKAVAKILKTDEQKIRAKIVNIKRLEEIEM